MLDIDNLFDNVKKLVDKFGEEELSTWLEFDQYRSLHEQFIGGQVNNAPTSVKPRNEVIPNNVSTFSLVAGFSQMHYDQAA